jgi:hypothetical protein
MPFKLLFNSGSSSFRIVVKIAIVQHVIQRVLEQVIKILTQMVRLYINLLSLKLLLNMPFTVNCCSPCQ